MGDSEACVRVCATFSVQAKGMPGESGRGSASQPPRKAAGIRGPSPPSARGPAGDPPGRRSTGQERPPTPAEPVGSRLDQPRWAGAGVGDRTGSPTDWAAQASKLYPIMILTVISPSRIYVYPRDVWR